MIDMRTETLVPLRAVPGLPMIPRRRRGAKLHVSTVFRWAQRGVRGVRLETLSIGAGQRCTSVEALQRFFDAISNVGQEDSSGARADPHRPVQAEAVNRALDELGI